jgi:hypothetical protein
MVRGYGREVGYAECYGWLQWWGWSGWWRSGGISNPDCNTLLRQNPPDSTREGLSTMTVPTLNPGVCTAVIARISYASLSVITRMTRWRRKQPVNHPKNLSTKTRIIGCIYSGKFGTEVTASVMGSCHHPNMVTPQRVKPEMTVSKS